MRVVLPRQWLEAAGDSLPRPHGNCYWLVQGRLLAGEHPAPHLPSLQAAGVSDYIDLTATDEARPAYREQLAAGQRWQGYGIRDYGVPSREGMRRILDALDALLLDDDRLVYLHCHGGVGRTGTVAACLLVEQGIPAAEALELLARKWRVVDKRHRAPASPETDEQRAFIRRWTLAPA